MIYITYYLSPIGKLLLASDGIFLTGLWIEGQKYFPKNLKEKVQNKDSEEILVKTKKWLEKYFNKEKPEITELELEPIGGEFRKRVWKILCEIPYGKVITYGEIARRVARETNKKSMSAQAIGGAVGHNPISIIIPCHRVVGSNGNLTGYAGGIDKKIKLLELEGVNINNFHLPK